MGVISTPPIPAAAMASSWAVMFLRSTALPGHHQRVHGFAVCVVGGHTEGGAAGISCATASDEQARGSIVPVISLLVLDARELRRDFHAIAFWIAYHAFVVSVARAPRT